MHPILTQYVTEARMSDLRREADHQRLVRQAKAARRRANPRPAAFLGRLVASFKSVTAKRPATARRSLQPKAC